MSLTKQTVVNASIGILNRDGIDGLSMRNLGKELNVKASALYNHFVDKAELCSAIAEDMCKRYEMAEPNTDKKAYLLEMNRSYRKMLLAVRDSPAIFEESVPNTPQRVEIIRAICDAWLAFGIKPKNLMTASNMVNNYVLSFVADEMRFSRQSPEDVDEFAKMLGPVEEMMFFGELDMDEQFEYGLRVLLKGMEE
ncbi:MAG: TetR/AcrR family transcriptional regulator C-terminal domain-containing protein [Clostridiales bacterium]|jgi:AcrR family transcriptional regulator|nr:TetR/AcrR family transcriptional regulator C-terminal domain-containing protein [Clostridiales bacterium]MDR2750228.1 TetR/AcrR family transcriptional regulator C-terminal domain-containing protein [Clostridiales bacterium]